MVTIYALIKEDNVIEAYADRRSMDREIEIVLPDDHPIFNDFSFYYTYIDGEVIRNDELELKRLRSQKDREMNAACEAAILAGFSHNINGVDYWFSYDDRAQTNFGDAKDALKDGIVQTVPWTVRIGGKDGKYSRIDIDLPIMQALSMTILIHKSGKISHYRDYLMPMIEEMTDPVKIMAVTWE